MSKKELILSVSRDRDYKYTKKELALVKKTKKCDFCGIDITKDHHIHERDDGVYASCSLCYYSENIDKLVGMRKGVIILMPEINQIMLNSIVRMIWYYKSIEDERYIDKVDTIIGLYDQIKERENFVESYYSDGANNIDILINALHNLPLEKYRKRATGLHGLLWLPEEEMFLEEIKVWNKEISRRFHPDNFIQLVEKVKENLEG